MTKGKLYLIPAPLGECSLDAILPREVVQRACSLKCFVVEEIRTARRFLSSYGLRGHIDGLDFHELNEHTSAEEVAQMSSLFDEGRDVGLITEAGLPAVADPGATLVALCHREGISVVPLVGPSSLMLALMASGLNGQSFAFCGYVSAKADERKAELKKLERRSRELHQSEILIETPYRNDSLLADLLSSLCESTRVCIAADITLESQFIQTHTVGEWKKLRPVVGKRPCVFIILA